MGKAKSSTKSPKSAGPTIEDVKATLRLLIEENAGIPADSIGDDSSMDSDLAMDSFSMLSVQVAVEDSFDVNFELSDLEERNRFEAICELILERIEAKKGPSSSGAKGRAKTSRAKSA